MKFRNIAIIALLPFMQGVWGTGYVVHLGSDNAPLGGGSGSGTTGDLRYVLNQILNNQAQESSPATYVITFSVSDVTLADIMPPINLFASDTITIGNSSGTTTIDGNGFRPFFIRQGSNVTLQNLAIVSSVAQGGNGADEGGGGGMGAGGAIFVDAATVTLNNVTFTSNTASAGLGASTTSNGGGGVELPL